MADYVLGMNAGLYFAADGVRDPSLMTRVDNVQDVTLNLEAGEADITTRGNNGWRAQVATLRECNADFMMLWKPGDAAFDAIQTAFMESTTMAFAILDQLYTVSGAQGMVADFSITNFSRNEPLEEAETVDVTLNLAEFGSWWEAP